MAYKLAIGLDGLTFRMTQIKPPETKINEWSYNGLIQIPVADFYFVTRWVTWKDKKTFVQDYAMFVMLIKQWVSSGMTKDEALELFFSAAE